MSHSFDGKKIMERVPVDPSFSLSDLKKAIPAHCFKQFVISSSYYVVHDLSVAYVFYFLVNTYIPFSLLIQFVQLAQFTGSVKLASPLAYESSLIKKGVAWVTCVYGILVLGLAILLRKSKKPNIIHSTCYPHNEHQNYKLTKVKM